MRKVAIAVLALGLVVATAADAANPVRISQVYAGGGSSGYYKCDYVELFNNSGSPVDIGGWSLQYGTSTGSFGTATWGRALIPAGATIPAGGYYLVSGSCGTGTNNLPVTPDLSFYANLPTNAGAKVALFADQVFNRSCTQAQSTAVDLVGYGGSTCYEFGAAAQAGASNVLVRGAGGGVDRDYNLTDLGLVSAGQPAALPRNSSSPANPQAGTGFDLRFEESFDFTGNLTANGWTQSKSGSPAIAASSPGLLYTGYASSGIGNSAAFAAAAGQHVSRRFPATSSGSVYAAFLLRGTGVGSGAHFIQLGQAQAGMNCNLHARSASGGFNLGISKAGTATWGSAVYALNSTYLVVMKYTFVTGTGNDAVELFVNPAIGSPEPTAIAASTSGTDATSLGYLQIQQYSTAQLAGRIDGIRIASTWADAVAGTAAPTPPDAPVATAATNVAATSFTANWNAASGATSYRLDVATDSGFGSYVTGYQDLTVSGTSQSVTGLTASTTYHYRVRAVNAYGTSGNSNTISATTGAAPPAGEPFTLVLIPDTQFYTSQQYGGTMAMYTAQTQWIVDNRVSRNIAAVGHLGDVTDDDTATEWQRADGAHDLLEDPVTTGLTDGIPYVMNFGNHDDNSGGTLFDQYFGVSRFSGRGYYGGHFGSTNKNSYILFSAGGLDWVMVSLQFHPDEISGLLSWANGIFDSYPNRKGILITHSMLYPGLDWTPGGQETYDALKDCPNLILAACGHINGSNWRTDVYGSNKLTTMVSDYQGDTNGGNGFLRFLEIDPPLNQVRAFTYSPYANQWRTDQYNQFVLNDVPLGGGAPTIPAAPVATAATGVTQSGFTANWNASSGASSYRLDVSTSSSFTSYVAGYQDLTVTGTSRAVSGLAASTNYYYRVRAVNAAGTSGSSNTVTVTTSATSTPPAAPVALAANNVLGTSFQANWNAATGATSYRLDVSDSEEFTTFVAGYQDLTVGGTLKTVRDLSTSTTYYYRVRAVNEYGTSGNSNVITVDTGPNAMPPAAPVATAATGVTTSGFTANWNAASGAASYLLDVSTSSSFTSYVPGYQDLPVSGTSQAVSGLAASTTYYYRVMAVNGDGSSDNSNTISVTTSSPALLEENFAFTGNLTANGWVQSGTGTPAIASSSPGLSYAGYAGSDVGNSAAFSAAAGEDVSRSFTAVSTGSLYLAFLLNGSSAGSTTGAYFFELGQAQAAMNCNLHTRSSGSGFNLGISKAGTATWGSAVYSLNTTYLVVMKYTFITGTGNDEVKLFVNPVIGNPEPTAAATSTSGTDATGLGYLQIQQYSANHLAGRLDGIRIATSWADAVAPGTPPDPPAAPVATAATGIYSTSFTANWNAASGATSYRLDVSTSSSFTSYVTGYQDKTVSGTSQAVTGLVASTTYYYRVRAANSGGTSGNSNTITVTTGTTPPPVGECELIVLPDTQEYTAEDKGGVIGMFTAQTQWVVSNRVARNIVAVSHVGDVNDAWYEPDVTTQYNRSLTAMTKLEDPVTTGLADGIPYSIIMGNHDYELTSRFNDFYGSWRFADRGYYGEGYPSGTNNNSYILFSGAGRDFVLVGLSYSVSSAELTWARGVLDAYPDRIGLVTSHAILDESSSIPAPWNGDGSAIYNALKVCPNLRMMFCGHMSESSSSPSWHGEGRRSDTYNGSTVWSVLSDYQDRENGGNGKLRIYQFVPAENKVRVRTYSPYTNTWEADSDSSSQFTLSVDLSPPGGAMMTGPLPDDGLEPHRALALATPAPNPARGTTWLSFDLPRAMRARLDVVDVQGRVVAVLADGEFPAGRTSRAWDGTSARGRAAGLYFVRLETPEGRLVRRVAILD